MSEAKRDFSKEAATWDEQPTRVKLAQDIASAIRSDVQLTPDMDVLDFGCGTGLVSLQLQPSVRTLTCVDSAQGMLDVLDAKAKMLGLENVQTRHIDLDAGGAITGNYHLIVSSMTFHHIPDVGALLSRFAAAMPSGARVCIADLDSEGGRFHGDNTGVFHLGFDRPVLRQAFQEAGFIDVRDRTAAEVVKPDAEGNPTPFSVFLMTGTRA
ncbi:MAG: methyltransferase domain-containing protein [FCB group bacterium]|jgi:2-polyprenyl-3-methyl-5-hydroxy-6-metoxy-1,4-benzoquinol methylase|nr:methyltransferase domain-containing protein [FCB group bacterium]